MGLFTSRAERLRQAGDVDGLIALLRDKSVLTREQAAVALGKLGDERGVEPLAESALESGYGPARHAMVEAIGQIGGVNARVVLRSLIQRGGARLAAAAGDELAKLHSVEAVNALVRAAEEMLDEDWDLDVSWSADNACRLLREQRGAGLLQDARDDDAEVAFAAASALEEDDRPGAVEALIAALDHAGQDVRREAAHVLGIRRAPEAALALAARLSDESPAVCRAAAGALERIPDERAAEALEQAARASLDPAVRRSAVIALGRIGRGDAGDALVDAAGDADGDVRAQALRAAAAAGDPRALDLARAALDSDEKHVRWAAADVIGQLGPERDPFVLDLLIDRVDEGGWIDRCRVVGAIARFDDGRALDVVGRLAGTAHRDGEEREVRQVALRTLGGMAGADVGVLERALGDEDPRIRGAAAEGLGALGSDRAAALLRDAPRDKDGTVRRHVLEALARVGDGHSRAAFVDGLRRSKDALAADTSARALAAAGETSELVAALHDRHAYVRYAALQTLESNPEPAAAVRLRELARSDPADDVRASAVRAIAALGDAAETPVIAEVLAQAKSAWVRRNAAEALARLGDPAGAGPLSAAAENDPDIRVRDTARKAILALDS